MTNTFIPQTRALVKIDNASNVLTDISSVVSTIAVNVSRNNAGFKTFGLPGEQRVAGKPSYNGTLGIRPTIEAGEGFDLLTAFFMTEEPDARTIEAYWPDDSAGSYILTGEVLPGNAPIVNQNAEGDGTPVNHDFAIDFDGSPSLDFVGA